jgi:serine/threonine protein kinase
MDLKPANILVNMEFSGAELTFDVKICDFGVSSFVDPHSEGIQEFAGTVNYMAPECVKQKGN